MILFDTSVLSLILRSLTGTRVFEELGLPTRRFWNFLEREISSRTFWRSIHHCLGDRLWAIPVSILIG